MDFYTTSSASSPFSQLSTDASSPEANTSAGETKTPPPAQMYGNEMMQTVNSNFNQAYGNMLDVKPQIQDIKPQINGGVATQNGHSAPPPSAFARMAGHQSVASSSRAPSSHGGARADKPTRKYPIEDVPTISPTVDELYAGSTSKGLVLLQGDPQAITKQRVETAIRAIIDLLHFVPPSLVPAPTDTNLLSLLPRGPDGQPQAHLARIGTFKTLRLQAGTTTKQMSKKQEQIKEQAKKNVKDPVALDASTIYLETAVYKSDGQTRVYACKRCRGREEKRRKSKESSRKNPISSDATRMSSSSPRQPKLQSSPSPEYVTGENAEEYDPMRVGQVVQEPTWNPDVADWRHEIIMFNNSPEMAIKEPGTVDWLPFRVVCYGKCHGEKTGFRIKFIIRTRDGRILGSDMTDPIRITDDHKTDKAKPRLEMSRAPPVARSRKATSAMSSRRTSPAASDDSLQSFSEAGAVVQRQAPHNRAKPYERPSVARHNSSSSIHSVASMSALPTNSFPDVPPSSAEWPNILNQPQQPPNNINLRRPFPGTMTPLNGDALSFTTSNPPSVHSSAVQSPISLQPMLDLDDIPHELASRFSALGQNMGQTQPMSFPTTNPMLFDGMDGFNGQQFNSMQDNGQDLFSASSYTSSFASDHSGLGLYTGDSVFSDSGLRPESTDDENDQMMNYLTIPDGADTLSQPFGLQAQPAPTASMGSMGNVPAPMAPAPGLFMPTASSVPQAPAPMISAVIPPNGPMSGGPDIAIIGMNLPSGAVVLFGGRPAETKASNPAVVQCILPPGIAPGQVEVTIQGYGNQAISGLFTYDGVTKEAMQLALDVKGHFPSNSNGSQMPQAFQQNTHNGAWASSNPPTDDDLQATLTNFLASIDQHAPGSMRHSGSINTRNTVRQTLLHLSTILGYHRLLRRLIVYGAQLDAQDINGFTPLAFAAYSGQLDCARVLIEAGATYDIPTNLGELPLDLAKISGDQAVEHLLLSAVWSTRAAPPPPSGKEEVDHVDEAIESDHSEVDNDNPSDASEDEAEVDAFIDRPPRRRRSKHKSRRPKVFMPDDRSMQANPADSVRRSPTTSDSESLANDYPSTPAGPSQQPPTRGPSTPPSGTLGIDSPPPYSPASWLDRFPLNTEQWKFPLMPQPIASMFHPKTTSSAEAGWVTLPVPAPSWETLQRMTSPEEVKLFTQAMAAAALNAVVQSGATTTMESPTTRRSRERERRKKRRSSGSGSTGTTSRSGGGSPGSGKVVKQVKKDRMLIFFWLPILLFFGFWIVVTALPIITGFGFLYARSITRYIKQRM